METHPLYVTPFTLKGIAQGLPTYAEGPPLTVTWPGPPHVVGSDDVVVALAMAEATHADEATTAQAAVNLVDTVEGDIGFRFCELWLAQSADDARSTAAGQRMDSSAARGNRVRAVGTKFRCSAGRSTR